MALEELVFSNNNFSGQIPTGLFGYGNLTLLNLSENDLTGVRPGVRRLDVACGAIYTLQRERRERAP